MRERQKALIGLIESATGIAVAAVEAFLRLERVVHAPYYALFLVGPAANVVEIWWNSRRPAAQPATMAS